MPSLHTHAVTLRLPDAFPLTGRECRVLLLAADALFHAVAEGRAEEYARYHPEVIALLGKLAGEAEAEAEEEEGSE